MNTIRPILMEEAGDAGTGGGGTATATRSLIGDAGKADTTTATTTTATTTGDTKPAVAETWWKGWVKEDGSLDKSRLTHLSDAEKADKAFLERFGKFDDFIKTAIHGSKMAREKGLLPLREGATKEEVDDFLARRARLNGAPEKPEGYGIKRPETLPEEAWDDDIMGRVAKAAHARGLSKDDLAALVNEHAAAVDEKLKAIQEENAAAEEKAWKEANAKLDTTFGPFKAERIKEAVHGARWMGIDPESPTFVQNADLIIAAQKVYSKIADAQFVNGGSAAASGQSAEAELEAMANNPAHKYYEVLRNPSKNPRLYEEAIQERRKVINRLESERRSRR
jgi:hypothetical protein